MGMNVIAFVYYFMGYALRHSHFWISYGPVLSHVFISPAQHQIHHSADKKHWDKNFGGTFALWDWLFGTLYIPRKKEDLTFGIGRESEWEFPSVWSLYAKPFQANFTSTARKLLVVALLGFVAYFAIENAIEWFGIQSQPLSH